MQPAVLVERGPRARFVAVVPAHDVVPSQPDLAFRGDEGLDPGKRRTDRPEPVAVRSIDVGGAGALGQAVPLEDQNAGGVKKLRDFACERRGAEGEKERARV